MLFHYSRADLEKTGALGMNGVSCVDFVLNKHSNMTVFDKKLSGTGLASASCTGLQESMAERQN